MLFFSLPKTGHANQVRYHWRAYRNNANFEEAIDHSSDACLTKCINCDSRVSFKHFLKVNYVKRIAVALELSIRFVNDFW